MRVSVARALSNSPILGFWGANFTKMCDSLPWTPMNRREKFDAASFILGGKKSVTVQTHTKTVTDISTLCLSA